MEGGQDGGSGHTAQNAARAGKNFDPELAQTLNPRIMGNTASAPATRIIFAIFINAQVSTSSVNSNFDLILLCLQNISV